MPIEHSDILVATEREVEGSAQSEHARTDDDNPVSLLKLAPGHYGENIIPLEWYAASILALARETLILDNGGIMSRRAMEKQYILYSRVSQYNCDAFGVQAPGHHPNARPGTWTLTSSRELLSAMLT